MIGLRQYSIYLWVFSFLVLTVSCAEENTADEGEDTEATEASVTEPVIEDQVHYQVPAPHEMMEFIKLSGSSYHPEVLVKTEIHDKFTDLKGKSMGMGIFVADLAYTASFSKFQESIKYFNVVIKMADDIGIGSAFDSQMLERIKNNLDNADSLDVISSKSYYKIIAELEANDRGKVVAMIAAGGWIESLYIATHLMPEYKEDHPMIKRIAGQKLVYENLMAYLQQYSTDESVSWAINDMLILKSVFDDVSDNSMDTKFTEKNGKRVLGGKGGVYITKQEYDELKAHIDYLRNTLTFNSPVTK